MATSKKSGSKKTGSKKSTSKKSSKKASSKRDLVKSTTSTMYAKRTASGKFKEMDNVGKSQTADRRTKAKKKTKSGYGDQGDQKKSAAKKR